jgi:hypothetical protein
MSAIGQDPAMAEAESSSSEPLAVQERHATLSPNFEAAAAKLFGSQWLQLLEEAVPVVGDSKPLQARYAAERLDTAQFSTRAGSALDALARRVCGGLSDCGAAPSANDSPRADAEASGRAAPSPWTPSSDLWEATSDPWEATSDPWAG